MKQSFMRMWGRPIVIAVSTTIGLIAALLGEGAWDWLSAATLAVPVACACWLGWGRRAHTGTK